MFKVINKMVPNIFSTYYVNNDTIHSHDTRQSSLLHVPKYRTQLGISFFKFPGVKIWNEIIMSITWEGKIAIFKRSIRNEIFAKF